MIARDITGHTAAARPVRKAYVDLPPGQLHCHQVDGIEPVIVFLHQTASSARSYDRLMTALDLPNRLVAIDTPGFGGSFDPPDGVSLQQYAAWILGGIDALGIAEFHLCGHHTGANLAIEIAGQAPERAKSVMLAGPAFMTPEERQEFSVHFHEPIRPRRDGEHLLENWRYAAGYNPDCEVEILHEEVTAMIRAWRGRPQAYLAVARHDAVAAARALACPALLLTSPDDYFHDQLDRARAILPDAPVAVTGGGNFQASLDPAGVARAIEAFIAGLARKVPD